MNGLGIINSILLFFYLLLSVIIKVVEDNCIIIFRMERCVFVNTPPACTHTHTSTRNPQGDQLRDTNWESSWQQQPLSGKVKTPWEYYCRPQVSHHKEHLHHWKWSRNNCLPVFRWFWDTSFPILTSLNLVIDILLVGFVCLLMIHRK